MTTVPITEAQRHPDLFRSVPVCSGEDSAGVIQISIDAERHLVGVRVLDAGRLRSPAALRRAAREAFFAADGERALRSVEQSGTAQEWLQQAEAEQGRPPRPRHALPDVSPAAWLERRERGDAVASSRRQHENHDGRGGRFHGTSENSYLTVGLDRSGRLVEVYVDEAWLLGATSEFLGRALHQAAAAAVDRANAERTIR